MFTLVEKLRRERGLNQYGLASGARVARRVVQRAEQADHSIKDSTLQRLAEFLGTTIREIRLDWETHNPREDQCATNRP